MQTAIKYRIMTIEMAGKLGEIDRSETIDKTYELEDGELQEKASQLECPNWDAVALQEIQERYVLQLISGGMAAGAFEEERLVGFGVLGHAFIGQDHDQLPVDLLYVSRDRRRQGIGTSILNIIGAEAKKRGAKYLYISSTETGSAVSFYRQNGSDMAAIVDEELFRKEPKDIHMIKPLF